MNKLRCSWPHSRSLALLPLSIALSIPATVTAESTLRLEEIIVTAQKREESLQDAAVSVTSLAGEELAEERITSVLDLQSQAPSLQVSTALGTARVYIRGIGLTNFASGGEPSVAFHVDGAVVSRPAAQISSFYDLERIEVLRGPQGSLYGRNATGGSLNVMSKRPTEEFEGYAKVTAGNYNLMELQGALSGTLIDNALLGRIAFRTQDRDGFGENLPTGKDLDDTNDESFRLGLSFIGSDVFSAFLSATHYESDDGSGAFHMLGGGNPEVAVPEIAMGGSIAHDTRDLNSEVDIRATKEIDSYTLELIWDLSENLSLKSLSNYLDMDRTGTIDLNGTPVVLLESDNHESSTQYSEELQLTWIGERHSTMFGLYYFSEDIDAGQYLPGSLGHLAAGRPLIQFEGSQESESWAAFVNSTWDLNQQWSINAGLRYSEDEKSDTGFTIPPGPPFQLPPVVLPIDRHQTWDAWTPTFTVEYTPANDLFFYATASRGYKTGVMNVGNAGAPVDPEYIQSYEIGMKSQWWDDRLQINATVFHATIEDLQVQRPINGTLVTVNAAEAETQGLEFESIARLTQGLTAQLNIAYIDSQFNDFQTQNTTFEPGVDVNLKGNSLPNTPELNTDLSLQYELDISSNWSAKFKLQGIYTTERWFNEFQEDIAHQDETFVINANVVLKTHDDRWSINLWGRNLGNDDIISHINVGSAALGHMRTATLQEPATYGATLGYKF
ncbi:TonB-dependent receptor [Pseudomaricurvus alkylphenolicus]|uniref:TonB-dependent receptor n=1 Tax=Pseudomaricurvus alkylphenolicus TaxID=1306991 RepID=UPI001423261F|nr:TonB-dependent receptor [Pseudomaricurvus alkylphenolicus]NIB43406.1 TonB-dependent receptor [Pseudomaricurvus alkylphenolicus]